jgi:lysophospholipase L1-like esterase
MVAATPTTRYVALGDSTGVGVGAADGRGYVARLHERLRRDRPDVELLNLCTSGATSDRLLAWQLPRALAALPAFATVFIGTNDLLHGVTPESFGANIERIAQSFAERRSRVLFCTLPNLAHAPAAQRYLGLVGLKRQLLETRALAFNERIVERAKAHGHLAHDLSDVALHDRSHFFSSDGFHPSSEGYEELARQLWPELRALSGAHA